MSDSHNFDPLLAIVYRAFAATFLVVGLLFFLFPDGTVDTLNRAGNPFGFPGAPHLSHRFWLGLGTSYMAVVTVLAWQIAAAPTARRLLMIPLGVGKAASSLTCLLFFLFDRSYFIYLANFLVDGSIVVMVWWTWRLSDPTRLSGAGEDAPSTHGFDRKSDAILRSIAEAVFPAGGVFPIGSEEIGLAAKMEAHIAALNPGMGPFLGGIILRVIDWDPVIWRLKRRRLSRMDLGERIESLEHMERSRLVVRRQAAHGLKLLLGLHAYRDPEVRAAIGYSLEYLEAKQRVAEARREAGDKGPYPEPVSPPAGATIF